MLTEDVLYIQEDLLYIIPSCVNYWYQSFGFCEQLEKNNCWKKHIICYSGLSMKAFKTL